MKKSLSQIKDVDQQILSQLDDKSLLDFCITHKYGSTLCKDELFWKKRFIKTYGYTEKNDNRSWKDFYMNIIYYNDKFKEGALYEASKKGMKNLDIIKFFLVRGRDLNQGFLGAVHSGDRSLVEYYIDRGANDFINAFLIAKEMKRNDLISLFRENGLLVFGAI